MISSSVTSTAVPKPQVKSAPPPPPPAPKPAATAAKLHTDSFDPGPAKAKVATSNVAQAAPATGGSAPTIDDVVDALKDGKTDEATRTMIAEYFTPLGMDESHEAMQKIRDEGLLDEFVDATVRDADGNPATEEVQAGVTTILETGRLDVYAETFANTPITVGDYGDGILQFNPGTPRGIELDRDTLASYGAQDVANILAHETFHAFSDAHGGDGYSALDEGLGIAAREYAFSDGDYNLAEMVYGTKNFYRDYRSEPDYELGDFSGADPKLGELVDAFTSRDSSQLAWDDPAQLQSDYKTFWEPLNRAQDFNTWLTDANQATADMLAARTTTSTPAAPAAPAAPANPVQQFWDWLTGLLG